MKSDLTAVSLFAGIGGIDEALRRAGVRVAAAVEIDPACRGVLARHFPETHLFNDVTEVTGDQLIAAGFVPGRGILAGGSPCQDFSVAGRRAGLGGTRSGLFWHIMRLADELRPRWLIFENVDGLLSSTCSCPGNDTCTANARSVRCGRWEKQHGERVFIPNVTHNPEGGACPGGCMGLHGGAMGTVLGAVGKRWDGVAYRILDAEYFGVPQRRNRVFIVGCAGDRGAPAEVLLEPEGGTGHLAQGGAARAGTAGHAAAGAGIARVADPLTTRPYADQAAAERQLVTAPTLMASAGGNHGAPGFGGADDTIMAVTVATLQGGGRRGHRIDAESAAGGHLIPVTQPEVSYALTGRDAKGPDSDMTSGFIFAPLTAGSAASPGVNRPGRRQEDDVNLVTEPAVQCVTGSVTHALTSEGADASEDGTGRGSPLVTVASPMAFNPNTGDSKGRIGYRETPTAISCSQPTGVQVPGAVRRLTPLERERLQGFDDNWTRWRLEDGELIEQSDSARDRQTGNAVAVPVVEWIARRVVAADAATRSAESGAA